MAVHIKLIKNNIKSSSSYGKYFAKAVSQGEVTLNEIAAEACRNRITGYSERETAGRSDGGTSWHRTFQSPCGEHRCG